MLLFEVKHQVPKGPNVNVAKNKTSDTHTPRMSTRRTSAAASSAFSFCFAIHSALITSQVRALTFVYANGAHPKLSHPGRTSHAHTDERMI